VKTGVWECQKYCVDQSRDQTGLEAAISQVLYGDEYTVTACSEDGIMTEEVGPTA